MTRDENVAQVAESTAAEAVTKTPEEIAIEKTAAEKAAAEAAARIIAIDNEKFSLAIPPNSELETEQRIIRDYSELVHRADSQGWAQIKMAERVGCIMQYEMKKGRKLDKDLVGAAISEAREGGSLQLTELSTILMHLSNHWEHGRTVKACAGEVLKHTGNIRSVRMSAIDRYLEKHPWQQEHAEAFITSWIERIKESVREQPRKRIDTTLTATFEAGMENEGGSIDKKYLLNAAVGRLFSEFPEHKDAISAWKKSYSSEIGSGWRGYARASDKLHGTDDHGPAHR